MHIICAYSYSQDLQLNVANATGRQSDENLVQRKSLRVGEGTSTFKFETALVDKHFESSRYCHH